MVVWCEQGEKKRGFQERGVLGALSCSDRERLEKGMSWGLGPEVLPFLSSEGSGIVTDTVEIAVIAAVAGWLPLYSDNCLSPAFSWTSALQACTKLWFW